MAPGIWLYVHVTPMALKSPRVVLKRPHLAFCLGYANLCLRNHMTRTYGPDRDS